MTSGDAGMSLLNGASIFPFVLLLGSTIDETMMKAALDSSLSMALAGAIGLIFVCGEVLSPDGLKQKKLVTMPNVPAANDASKNIYQVADKLVDELQHHELSSLHSADSRGKVPSQIDGRLLANCREQLNRDLKQSEKREARTHLINLARAKYPA